MEEQHMQAQPSVCCFPTGQLLSTINLTAEGTGKILAATFQLPSSACHVTHSLEKVTLPPWGRWEHERSGMN